MLGLWAALLPQLPSLGTSPIDAASLGVWALQFTPRVALLEEAAVAELDASARLFGGTKALRALIEGGAAELGAAVAWAPTGTAALAIVRHATEAEEADGFRAPLERLLDRLPLEAITAVRAHQPTLARVGCRTLGDVRRLPRGGLSRRFDKARQARKQAGGLAAVQEA